MLLDFNMSNPFDLRDVWQWPIPLMEEQLSADGS